MVAKKNDRIEYAKKFQSFLRNEILFKIPALSPSQLEWLRHEQKIYRETQNERRFEKALQVDEFKYYVLREFTEDSISDLDGILRNNNKELYHWARFSNGLLNLTYWQLIYEMAQRKIIDCFEFDSLNKSLLQFYVENGVAVSQGIISNIIQLQLFVDSQ